jgi:hypothetical protein
MRRYRIRIIMLALARLDARNATRTGAAKVSRKLWDGYCVLGDAADFC